MDKDRMVSMLNTHLAKGGSVAVSTRTRTTVYKQRHAGWFAVKDNAVCVRAGKRFDRLSTPDRLLVRIEAF